MGSEKLATDPLAKYARCDVVKRKAAQTEGGEKPLGRPNGAAFPRGYEPDDCPCGSKVVNGTCDNSKCPEPSSPPATAAHNKYFVDRTPEGWGIFYTEPAAPETGRACIGGSKDEHIARLRCQILNSHLADVLEAVEFANYVYWCDGCNAVKRALEALKSSEGAK